MNRQPWRLVVCNDRVHFYERSSLGSSGGWDVQKVDMGIALYHFALGMPDARFVVEDPGISHPNDFGYIASFEILC